MTRVLLVCPEPLGHRQPAGIGVRFLEMARVLRGDGHEVTIMSPDAGAVDGCCSVPHGPDSIQSETARVEVAVVQGHAANDLFAHGKPIPVVVDLYDPFVIENLHYYRRRGSEVFAHDHATLMNSLVHGDYFLCASQAQRSFYLGLLLAAGRVNPALFDRDPRMTSLVGIAPFGVQPARNRRSSSSSSVLFGGIYDWYDPVLAVEAIAIARRSIPDLTLTFTRHPNPALTPQGKAAETLEFVRQSGYQEFVRFEPWVPYEERGAFFEQYRLALLTFPQSIETELAMRTRVYDYLWGGLPVITSSAPGTDEILRRYEAGAVLPTDDAAAFATEIVTLLRDRSRYDRLEAGTRRFVRDHQWPVVLEPLREFVLRPRVDPTKEAYAMRLHAPEHAASLFERLKRRVGGVF